MCEGLPGICGQRSAIDCEDIGEDRVRTFQSLGFEPE